MSERDPVLAEVINVAIERGSRSVRVSMPGRIEKFNAAEQTADVKPLLHDHVENEDGTESSEPVDVLTRVPIKVVGGGGFAATFPIAVGDECLLVFGDRSMDVWFERGGDVDPIDLRRHSISDAVAIVGLRSKGNALSEYDTARAVFGKQGGKRVAVAASAVHLGVDHNESATQSVLKGDDYLDAESTFVTAMGTSTSTAGGGLTSATALMVSAAALNAIPIVGGALSAALWISASAGIGTDGGALTAINPTTATFKTQAALTKSAIVKTK